MRSLNQHIQFCGLGQGVVAFAQAFFEGRLQRDQALLLLC